MSLNPTKRFSDRVHYYVKYRPEYPTEIVDLLKEACALSKSSTIADIGSGTGFLSELFLQNGNKVFGIEPNPEMRMAAEDRFADKPHFISINGRAESTGLEESTIDFITAGQAFHWFDLEKTKSEFKRILKSHGFVVLIWNVRKLDATPFLTAYEKFLHKYGTDYKKVQYKTVASQLVENFFGKCQYKLEIFSNSQKLNYVGLEGRLLSSSYVPAYGKTNHNRMLEGLASIFNECNIGGYVTFEYDTKVFFGKLN